MKALIVVLATLSLVIFAFVYPIFFEWYTSTYKVNFYLALYLSSVLWSLLFFGLLYTLIKLSHYSK